MFDWLRNKIRDKFKLKTYRVRVVNQARTGLVWHEVMAVNEEEALLMANYISWESWEA